ncbi:MAG: hypothetical protein RLZ37_2261, partial [Actinomycetota bacterium]
RSDGESSDGNRGAVLPSLSGVEHEEAHFPMSDDDCDDHDSDDPRSSDGREEPERHQQAGADLRECCDSRLRRGPFEADAGEPRCCSRQAVRTEDLVDAVICEKESEAQSQKKESRVHLVDRRADRIRCEHLSHTSETPRSGPVE